METDTITEKSAEAKPLETLDEVAIRFAGDSGDGMQLAGTQFTASSAIFGNDISTFPDFPAEIRAPAGTLAGVSGFQINFSSHEIFTPGDRIKALVAFNAAALKTNVSDVEDGGLVIVNEESFGTSDLQKAGYKSNPLEDGTLSKYQVFKVPFSRLNREALKDSELSNKQKERSKNFFALGVMYWLFDRPMDPTLRWIEDKFGKNPAVAEANIKVLKAGYFYGETAELFQRRYQVPKAKLAPGTYRSIGGNEALALGFVTAAHLAKKQLIYCSYPITPASDILHELSRRKNFGVLTFQAEDEIAAVTAAIGVAFAGHIGLTGTSGPGMALKGEAIGLAVMTELPLIIVNVQRGGPSTGLPTKTEQADLLQAVVGRNSECPCCVIAASSPSDCFNMAIEAVRIATRYMLPVIVLTDGYIANGEEPWLIPDVEDLPKLEIKHPKQGDYNGSPFLPYQRNGELARPWALPGTPGLEHRIGGLEKEDITGNVCYEPDNHQHMVHLRAQKVANIANSIPALEVFGPKTGELLVLGWGGTAGAIRSAVEHVQRKGHSVAYAHLRYMNPFPKNLGEVLKSFKQVLIPELNMGQLRMMIRSQFLVDAVGYNKIKGKPFLVSELDAKILEMLSERSKR